VESAQEIHHLHFNSRPSCLVEARPEAVRTRGTAPIHRSSSSSSFLHFFPFLSFEEETAQIPVAATVFL
jgi:hypothetical protein